MADYIKMPIHETKIPGYSNLSLTEQKQVLKKTLKHLDNETTRAFHQIDNRVDLEKIMLQKKQTEDQIEKINQELKNQGKEVKNEGQFGN